MLTQRKLAVARKEQERAASATKVESSRVRPIPNNAKPRAKLLVIMTFADKTNVIGAITVIATNLKIEMIIHSGDVPGDHVEPTTIITALNADADVGNNNAGESHCTQTSPPPMRRIAAY